MNKKYLNQMLTYFSKVYHIDEKIKGLKDKRFNPSIKTSTISLVVLISFMLQIRSFNRLEHWLERNKFKRLMPKKAKLPRIDAVRRSLMEFELDSLNNMYDDIIKTAIKNKILKTGTIGGFKVSAIDGVELFESTKKCCSNCLTRESKQGGIHYFHRAVTVMTVGSDPHLMLGEEMLLPKEDSSDKNEGELTGGKRLIRKLHEKFNHFADIIVGDALYMNSIWLNEVLSLGMDAVVRVKSERLLIVKDALALFSKCEASKEWTVKKSSNKKIIISAWDDQFEMTGMDSKVRFLKFIEEIHANDKVEIKEVWIVTTSKYAPAETLWEIIHKRWDIENNGFHQLKTEWHLDHCFLHDPTGINAVLKFILISFNLMQLYFFRCIRGFREKRFLQIDIIEDLRDEMLTYKNKNGFLTDST